MIQPNPVQLGIGTGQILKELLKAGDLGRLDSLIGYDVSILRAQARHAQRGRRTDFPYQS